MAESYRNVLISGTIVYYKDERTKELHRTDGPAVVKLDGTRAWWVNGTRHRLDGPAIEYPNGDKTWFVNGRFLCWVDSDSEIIDKLDP